MKLLKEYAPREGYEIVGEYVDVETAKKLGRTNYKEMVAFLKKDAKSRRENRCRTILVKKTDRLYRNLLDYGTLDDSKVEVHFVKEGEVLSPESHSSRKFVHGIKVLMAKNYIDNLSEETRKGMREKAEQGIWPSKAPTGYRKIPGPNGKKIIEVDPETGPIVQRIFERYGTGRFSMEVIGRMAMEEGLELKRVGNFWAGIRTIELVLGQWRAVARISPTL